MATARRVSANFGRASNSPSLSGTPLGANVSIHALYVSGLSARLRWKELLSSE